MEIQGDNNYVLAVKQIKTAILKSRYEAAALANKELLKLYFGIGQYVSFHSRNKNWEKVPLIVFRVCCNKSFTD